MKSAALNICSYYTAQRWRANEPGNHLWSSLRQRSENSHDSLGTSHHFASTDAITQSVARGPGVAASPGSLSERQSLGPTQTWIGAWILTRSLRFMYIFKSEVACPRSGLHVHTRSFFELSNKALSDKQGRCSAPHSRQNNGETGWRFSLGDANLGLEARTSDT